MIFGLFGLWYNFFMSSNDQPATKVDVEEIVERVVTKSIGATTTQILTSVGDQFDPINDQLEEIRVDVRHIRNKLDATTDNTDGHEVRISKLEKQVL